MNNRNKFLVLMANANVPSNGGQNTIYDNGYAFNFGIDNKGRVFVSFPVMVVLCDAGQIQPCTAAVLRVYQRDADDMTTFQFNLMTLGLNFKTSPITQENFLYDALGQFDLSKLAELFDGKTLNFCDLSHVDSKEYPTWMDVTFDRSKIQYTTT